MTEEVLPSETVDLEDGSLVLLRFVRVWPHYAVEWSVRRRSSDGESSFPVTQGRVEGGANPDWDDLRAQALAAAEAARGDAVPRESGGSESSPLTRMFRRFSRRE